MRTLDLIRNTSLIGLKQIGATAASSRAAFRLHPTLRHVYHAIMGIAIDMIIAFADFLQIKSYVPELHGAALSDYLCVCPHTCSQAYSGHPPLYLPSAASPDHVARSTHFFWLSLLSPSAHACMALP